MCIILDFLFKSYTDLFKLFTDTGIGKIKKYLSYPLGCYILIYFRVSARGGPGRPGPPTQHHRGNIPPPC